MTWNENSSESDVGEILSVTSLDNDGDGGDRDDGVGMATVVSPLEVLHEQMREMRRLLHLLISSRRGWNDYPKYLCYCCANVQNSKRC